MDARCRRVSGRASNERREKGGRKRRIGDVVHPSVCKRNFAVVSRMDRILKG
jgi:hypothetical protein